jgi:hypothetical protein
MENLEPNTRVSCFLSITGKVNRGHDSLICSDVLQAQEPSPTVTASRFRSKVASQRFPSVLAR